MVDCVFSVSCSLLAPVLLILSPKKSPTNPEPFVPEVYCPVGMEPNIGLGLRLYRPQVKVYEVAGTLPEEFLAYRKP